MIVYRKDTRHRAKICLVLFCEKQVRVQVYKKIRQIKVRINVIENIGRNYIKQVNGAKKIIISI